VPREEIHCRRLEIHGYRRADGLFDIEGRLTDAKPFPYELLEKSLAAGEPIHDMRLRLTVDLDLTVRQVEAWTASGPYTACGDAHGSFAALVGLRIGPGWNRRTKELLGGARGCTHMVEMLGQMATTAMQTVWSIRQGDGRPDRAQVDGCYAYAADGALVASQWPELARPPLAPGAD